MRFAWKSQYAFVVGAKSFPTIKMSNTSAIIMLYGYSTFLPKVYKYLVILLCNYYYVINIYHHYKIFCQLSLNLHSIPVLSLVWFSRGVWSRFNYTSITVMSKCFVHTRICIWVRSLRCASLVTWFCYQTIAKPGNKTSTPSWPDPYGSDHYTAAVLLLGFAINW